MRPGLPGANCVQTLSVKTDRRTQLVEVTAQVQKAVAAGGVGRGVCYLYVPHTTAEITINECADPDVARDVESALDRLIPKTEPFRHSEGSSDSHVKAVLVGTSQMVLVEDGKLVLGRWQDVFFCEFDGPRDRRLHVKVVADEGPVSGED
jgi:secondary thiamine-phosphate synthase enzyme